jgi:hypothetical protein
MLAIVNGFDSPSTPTIAPPVGSANAVGIEIKLIAVSICRLERLMLPVFLQAFAFSLQATQQFFCAFQMRLKMTFIFVP